MSHTQMRIARAIGGFLMGWALGSWFIGQDGPILPMIFFLGLFITGFFWHKNDSVN